MSPFTTPYDLAVQADNPASYWKFGIDPGTPPAAAVDPLAGFVYDDNRLLNDWTAAHTNSTVNLGRANPITTVHSQIIAVHRYCIAWQALGGYAELAFHRPAGFDLSPYSHIAFHALAPVLSQEFVVFVADANRKIVGGFKRFGGTDNRTKLFTAAGVNGGVPIYFVDLAADLGLTRPFPTISYLIFQDASGGGWATSNFIDEVSFRRTRARSVPNHANVYAENRPRNFVMNHAPLYDKGPNPFTGRNADLATYWDKLTGDCAGETRAILEWASRKWGWHTGTADPIRGNGPPTSGIAGDGGGSLNDLLLAQAAAESAWKNEFQSDPTVLGGLTVMDSKGIGQQRGSYFPPYYLPILSTAFSADYKAMLGKRIFNGDSEHAAMSPSPVGNIRLTLQTYFAGNPSGGEFATYPCRILGGTSTENGVYYPGFINQRPWLSPTTWPTNGGALMRD